MKFSGRAILFNTVVSLVLVLRYLMTFLRNMGLAHKLPLDHNIYFHKVVGWIIFVQAWLHTISHLINFGEIFELLCSCVYQPIVGPHIQLRPSVDYQYHHLFTTFFMDTYDS